MQPFDFFFPLYMNVKEVMVLWKSCLR